MTKDEMKDKLKEWITARAYKAYSAQNELKNINEVDKQFSFMRDLVNGDTQASV